MAAYPIGRHFIHAFVLGTPELAAYRSDRRQDSLLRADVADRLFSGRTFLTGEEVVLALGWSKRLARESLVPLTEAGMIAPEAGASTSEIPPIYCQAKLDASIGTFFDRFETVDPHGSDMASLQEITFSFGLQNEKLWHLLARGEIRQLGRVHSEGIVPGMRLNKKEVISAISGIADPVNTNEAADILGLNGDRVRSLVAAGYLVPEKPSMDLPKRLTPLFSEKRVRSFAAEFVSGRQARSMLGSQVTLSKSGLKPAVVLEAKAPRGARVYLFRRSDVEAFQQVDRS
jgi:hypothetical protein